MSARAHILWDGRHRCHKHRIRFRLKYIRYDQRRPYLLRSKDIVYVVENTIIPFKLSYRELLYSWHAVPVDYRKLR